MKLIIASLSFEARQVREIMTPKSVIETIKKGEILGPLVLDDLHKTGHSRFPVIDGDIDHIVGILHIKDVLTLDTSKKHTSKVESAMNKHVHYIRDDHTLDQALSAFLSTHSHLFVVINEFRETVGILTLEDTLEALLGRSIIDEFDAHDDMRAVAARKAKHGSLNHSSESVDV
jgi:CBS domain containing-hemolysin-like protein